MVNHPLSQALPWGLRATTGLQIWDYKHGCMWWKPNNVRRDKATHCQYVLIIKCVNICSMANSNVDGWRQKHDWEYVHCKMKEIILAILLIWPIADLVMLLKCLERLTPRSLASRIQCKPWKPKVWLTQSVCAMGPHIITLVLSLFSIAGSYGIFHNLMAARQAVIEVTEVRSDGFRDK